MKLGKIDFNLGKESRKIIAAVSAVSLLFASGCTFNLSVDESEKDDTNEHAVIVENEINTPDVSTNTTQPDSNTDDNQTGSGDDTQNKVTLIENENWGFESAYPGSFADRIQGLYKVESDTEEAYVEFYNIGGNIYGYYSGDEYGFMELFAISEEGFVSKDEDSMEVEMTTMVIEDHNSLLSNGLPASFTMTLLDNGIELSNYDSTSGEMLFEEDAKLTKIEGEMGHLPGFSYADGKENVAKICGDVGLEIGGCPDEIEGSWILLGDTSDALMLEFTDKGYVQAYSKTDGIPVILMRGTYVEAKDKVNGGTDIYLALHYPTDGGVLTFEFCYVEENGALSVVDGSLQFGMNVAWEGALFIPYSLEDIPRHFCDLDYGFSDTEGTYHSGDGYELILSDDGFFYLYEENGEESMKIADGYCEANPGGYNLYVSDLKGEEEDELYGFIAFMEQGVIDLTLYETGETIEFYYVY